MGGTRPGASAGPLLGRRLVQHPGIALLSKAFERQRKRERETGVIPSSPAPRKGPRRAAALSRAKGPQRAKRHCRRSSCRRLRPPPRWTGSRSTAWTAQAFPGNPGSAPALPRLRNKAKPPRLGLGPAPGDEDGDEWSSTKGMGPCYVFPSTGAGSVARQGSAGAQRTRVLLEPQRWQCRGFV